MLNVTVNTDGACSGSPGPAGIGAVGFKDGREEDGSLFELSEFIGHGTNNLAEYVAIERALEEAKKLNAHSVLIRSDSLNTVRCLEGTWTCKAPTLQPLCRAVQDLMKTFPGGVRLVHVYDEANLAADRLARAAVKRGRNAS